MPIGILYSDVEACLPLPEDDLGVRIVKAHVIFPQIAAAVLAYERNPDGSLTTAYKAELAAIDCSAFT